MALLKGIQEAYDTEWEPGPGEHDIVHYDDVRVKYRKRVEDYVARFKSTNDILKRKFVFISTNVLCAVVDSDTEQIPNYIRDLYMPVELSVTKWSLNMEVENYETHHFMFHPGEPARNCRVEAKKHLPNHKIEGIQEGPFETSPDKYHEVLSKIYQLVSSDYTLFSLSLKHIRQDLGSIKWLIDQVCGPHGNRRKYKPLKIYSIHDLYLCIARRVGFPASVIGDAVAQKKLGGSTGWEYHPKFLCEYHKQGQYESGNCTRANCIAKAKRFSEDIKDFQRIVKTLPQDEMPAEDGRQHVRAGPSGLQRQHVGGDTVDDLGDSFRSLSTKYTSSSKPPKK